MTTTVPRDEELRLALVMNGGVSLAVWIGGVAHEINRFVGETHPVYRQLLELTSTSARVDVISGTSAGGVNGAALALCCVYDTTLYSLRDLWLSKGAFADLLRQSGQQDAASLLDGDGHFLPALQAAFGGLLRERPRLAAQAPMNLALTSTMLRAEPHSRLDDLGERIDDGHHRALFGFERGAAPDPFEEPPQLAKLLAGAARASASFPVAFEPRLFGRDQFTNGHTREAARFDRYLIDGGVLDNKPLRGALDAIFKLPATGNVRRVLAYIAPDPAVTAAPQPDKPNQPPSITEVAMASLLGIPAAQSITDQLQEIDEHNTEVRRQRHTFAWLAANLTTADLQATAKSFFSAYRERRIDGLLGYVLDEVEAGLRDASGTSPDDVAFGRRTRDWLKALWRQAPAAEQTWIGRLRQDYLQCGKPKKAPAAEQAWIGRIPSDDDKWKFDLKAAVPAGWTWGIYAIEFIASVMLDLLRRTQRLMHLQGQTGNVVTTAPPIPAAYNARSNEHDGADAETIAETLDWDLQDTLERNRRFGAPSEDVLSQKQGLAPLWQHAYKALEDIEASRRRDTINLRNSAPTLLARLRELDAAQGHMEHARIANISAEIVAWLPQSVAPVDGIEALMHRNASLARDIAKVLLDLGSGLMRSLTDGSARALRPEERLRLAELTRLHQLLFADDPDANELMRRLLQLEIGHYSMAGRSQTPDAAVELVQISGRGKVPGAGRALRRPSSPGCN